MVSDPNMQIISDPSGSGSKALVLARRYLTKGTDAGTLAVNVSSTIIRMPDLCFAVYVPVECVAFIKVHLHLCTTVG
jgi:hypothetical protein